jgi:hypothetical protein
MSLRLFKGQEGYSSWLLWATFLWTLCALSCGVYRDQQHHCIDKSCVELLGSEILWLACLLLKLCQIEIAKISSTSCSIYSCFVRGNFCVKGLWALNKLLSVSHMLLEHITEVWDVSTLVSLDMQPFSSL